MPRGCLLFAWGNIPVWGHQCRRIYDSWWYWQRKFTRNHKKTLLYFQLVYLNMSIWPCIVYPAILHHFHFQYVSVAILPKVLPGFKPQNLQLIYQMWFQHVSEFWGKEELQKFPRAAGDQTSVLARRKAWEN